MDPVRGATSLVGNATGNTDALSATCNPNNPRGWERRFEHSIIVLDGDGNLIDEWPYLDELFSQLPCGRGPHQIKISPYDQEKHVWIIDDQLHVIYRFTYDGQLVHTLGELGVAKFDADDNFIMDWGSAPADADNPGDLDGNYLYSWGAPGCRRGAWPARTGSRPTRTATSICFAERVQKFEPIARADPAKLVGCGSTRRGTDRVAQN